MVFFLAWFVVKPLAREGRIPFDGLLVLAFLLLFWEDPLFDLFGFSATYASFLPNWGNWLSFVPGHLLPNAHRVAEGPWQLTWYGSVLVGIVLLTNKFTRWIKHRRPQTSPAGLFFLTYAALVVFDVIFEETYIRVLGLYVFTNPIKSITLFYGHYYEFPLSEAVLFGGYMAGMGWLRYARDDKGEWSIERGISRLRVGRKTKTLLRFLAIYGCASLVEITFCLSISFLGLFGSGTPRDILTRSYFTNFICGAQTNYACPTASTGIDRPNAIHLGPNGKLFVPATAVLPREVPFATK
jgi:hypothetical protein